MGKTLVFMGDSITDCGHTTSNTDGSPNVGLGNGYPILIGAKLRGEQPKLDWSIYNRGISGNRIVDLYARWKRDTLNLNPDIISILIGVNDVWHEKSHQNGVETPRFEMFYKMLLDWTLEKLPNVKLILLEPFVLEFGAVQGKDWIDEVAEKAAVTRKMAKKYNTAFVPLQGILNKATKLAPQEYWLRDGVHPTLAGHQLIANAWFKEATKIGIKL